MTSMSAVSLHNSIYYRDSTDGRPNFAHSRNLSTVSSATLLTNTTLHSQPTEPLLPHNSHPQGSDDHVVSRTTRTHFAPKREHDFQNSTAPSSEERDIRSILRRKPLRAMRWLKTGLDVVIGEFLMASSVTASHMSGGVLHLTQLEGYWSANYSFSRYMGIVQHRAIPPCVHHLRLDEWRICLLGLGSLLWPIIRLPHMRHRILSIPTPVTSAWRFLQHAIHYILDPHIRLNPPSVYASRSQLWACICLEERV